MGKGMPHNDHDDNAFKEKAVSKDKPKSNFTPRGRSGTLVTGFEIQDDYLQEFIGIPGQELCHKMLLSDSQIRKPVHAISNPIRSAKWDIEPASDETKDLEVAALMKHILFKDLPGGFKCKLDEILKFPWHGHSIFEIHHANNFDKKFGHYTGLANLAYRDQRTIDKWDFNELGILTRIHQLQHGDIQVNEWLDTDTLLIFYNEKIGNNSGYPFCRMWYGNYKRKLLYKELQAIGIERAAIPVPHLTVPTTVEFESDEYLDAVDQLEAFTLAQQAFFVTPEGYKLDYYQTGTYDPKKVQSAIKAENEEISGAVVAMFLEMGIGGNSAVGSSTGESVKFFTAGIEYIADKISDGFNLSLIPDLVRMNFGDTVETMPKLIHSGIADEAGKELMEIITGYTEKGIITVDEGLEDHARKVHNLPKKDEGEMLDNKKTQDDKEKEPKPDPKDPVDPKPIDDDEEIELASKGKAKTPRILITSQAVKISDDIRKALEFSSAKYINDVMARYRQLPESRKQNATGKVKMGGVNNLKKDLKRALTETIVLSIDMARSEIPAKKDIELNNHDRDMLRMTTKYGDISEIKLNDFSKLPTHIQVLIAKQADLISEASLADLKARIDFSFSSIETKSSDENVIQQSMEEDAEEFSSSNRINTKGTNSSALMVNEGRDTFFFEPDVLDEIHSFTFVNIAPVAAICKELAGTTFNTNDAESLRYSPPLHHNCKSYLRANLKISKGLGALEVSTLSPSATAKKSITL